jgi:hypothetical protein
VAKEWRSVWGVAGFGDTGRARVGGDGTLDGRFVKVVAAGLAGGRVEIVPCGRENPLPGPFAWRGGVLSAEGVG